MWSPALSRTPAPLTAFVHEAVSHKVSLLWTDQWTGYEGLSKQAIRTQPLTIASVDMLSVPSTEEARGPEKADCGLTDGEPWPTGGDGLGPYRKPSRSFAQPGLRCRRFSRLCSPYALGLFFVRTLSICAAHRVAHLFTALTLWQLRLTAPGHWSARPRIVVASRPGASRRGARSHQTDNVRRVA